MRRRSIMFGALVSFGVVGSSAVVHAEGGPTLGIEPEDDHTRPREYQMRLPMPPFEAGGSEYPLAAGFISAHSSNYTAGDLRSFDYIVVHTMQGYYEGSISWFQNPSANVSAHYLISSETGEITQMVKAADKAWHVGNSNPHALGIEHEGFIDEPGWYTWVTYAESALLTRWMCEEYGIPVDRDHIVGHVELPNQTHTDPGDLWNWGIYMALIEDVVPEGRIEGFVADRSRSCTLTANTDTWLKATLEGADALGESEKCFVAAGESLQYVHASGDMNDHRRLALTGDHPCADAPGLAVDTFAFEAHFDGLCDLDDLAADVQVSLDGGEPIWVEPDGSFAFDGVAPGEHVIDVVSDDFESVSGSVTLDVYPGARIVLQTDPLAGGDDGGGSDGGEGDDGAGESGDGSGSDPVPPASDSGESDGGTGGGVDPALPTTYGADDDEGACACTQSSTPPSAWLTLLLVGLLRRRRRR